MKIIKERDVERRLVQEVRKRGGLCWKFTSPGTAGVPDRILLMMGGRTAFVEVKAPGKKMHPLQLRRKAQLESLGFRVYLLDDPKQIDLLLTDVCRGASPPP